MPVFRHQYTELLKNIFSQKIEVRPMGSHLANDTATYYRNGLSGNNTRPAIVIPRARGGSWVNDQSSQLEIDAFLDGSADLERELILMAHEFGHHHSTFQHYEPLMSAFKADNASITPEQIGQLLDEERFAWAEGRKQLTAIGFDNFTRFEAIERESVVTYETGLRGLSE